MAKAKDTKNNSGFPDVTGLSNATKDDGKFLSEYRQSMKEWRAIQPSFIQELDKIFAELGGSIETTVNDYNRYVDGVHAQQLRRVEGRAEEYWDKYQAECEARAADRQRRNEEDERRREAELNDDSEFYRGLTNLLGGPAILIVFVIGAFFLAAAL